MIVNFALLFLIIPLFSSKSQQVYEHRYDCCDQENEGFKKKAKEVLENSNTTLTNGLETILEHFQTRIKNRIIWPANDVIIEIKKQTGLFDLTTKNNDYILKLTQLRGKSTHFEMLIDNLEASLKPGTCKSKINEHENTLSIQNRLVKMEKMVKTVHKNTNEITSKIDEMEDNLEKKAAAHLINVDIAKKEIQKNIGVIQSRIRHSLALLQKPKTEHSLDPRNYEDYLVTRFWFYTISLFLIIASTLPIWSTILFYTLKKPHALVISIYLVGMFLVLALLLGFFFTRMAIWTSRNKETGTICTGRFDESVVSSFKAGFMGNHFHRIEQLTDSTCTSPNDKLFTQFSIKDVISTNSIIQTINIDYLKYQLISQIHNDKLKAINLQQDFSDEVAKIEILIKLIDELRNAHCLNNDIIIDIRHYQRDLKQFVEDSENYKNSLGKFNGNYETIAKIYFENFSKESRFAIESSIHKVYEHIDSADFSCQSIIQQTSTCPVSPEHAHYSFFWDCLLAISIISFILQVIPSPWISFEPEDEPEEAEQENTSDQNAISSPSSTTLSTAEENENSTSVSRSRTGLDVESVCILEQPVRRGAPNIWMEKAMNNDPDCSISTVSSGYNTIIENESNVENWVREESC